MNIKFYETMEDSKLKFAVIISKYEGKWVYCKHKDRDTYEIPGGHREEHETIFDTAKRELYEETGAVEFEIRPVCVYSVTGQNRVNESGEETFGMLYYAEISVFDCNLHYEMEKVELFDKLPADLTYPQIQPVLMQEFLRRSMNMIDFTTTTTTACGECCIGCKKKEAGTCQGCIESDGHCEEWAQSGGCPIYKCAHEHHVQFCGICSEFPCKWLQEKVTWNPNIAEHLTELAKRYNDEITIKVVI